MRPSISLLKSSALIRTAPPRRPPSPGCARGGKQKRDRLDPGFLLRLWLWCHLTDAIKSAGRFRGIWIDEIKEAGLGEIRGDGRPIDGVSRSFDDVNSVWLIENA